MRKIEYHPSNFEEVSNILEASRSGVSKDRVIFNSTRKRFEHYTFDEKTSSLTDEYTHVEEAIMNYIRNNAEGLAELNGNALTVNDEPVDRVTDFAELDTEIPDIDVEPAFPEIDDSELLETANANLNVLTELKDKANKESREKLLQVIANLYNFDMVSESDIARSIVETNELKKLLSMLYSKLGIEVSSTRISSDLVVTSGQLKFQPKIEYGLDDYRRGAAQCLSTVNMLSAAKEQLDDKDRRIQDLTRELGTERRVSSETSAELNKLKDEKTEARKLKSLIPMEYLITYDTPTGPRYIYASKEKFAEDGSIPTKYLNASSRLEKARRFTLEAARVQIARMIRHNNNVTFVDLKDKGSKELSKFFSIHATAVVKIEDEQ